MTQPTPPAIPPLPPKTSADPQPEPKPRTLVSYANPEARRIMADFLNR